MLAFALLPAAPATSFADVTANGRLQIIHLDVGQGDGALIISPLGEVVMIDNGPGGTGAMGQTVAQQLTALGVTHIKHIFASHYHSDHLGGIDEVVNAGIAFDYAWDRGSSYSTTYYTTYVNLVGTKRRTLVKDQVITLDSLSAHPVTIKCVNLNGAGISTTDENSLSVMLKISYGEFDESFGGDTPGQNSGSYKNIETTVGPQVGPIEVYKVHHHGSATSSQTAWLNATTPKIAVISEGNGNSYGHPTSAALGRLHTANVHTYWLETGAGVAPLAGWDKVSNGQVIISATWQGGGVDTIRGNGFADTFTNSGSAGDVTAPVVAVTSPDGGETWKAGSSHQVTWSATDNVGVSSVDLAWSSDGGASFANPIALGIANSGAWWWTVPNLPSGSARVRVIARDAAGNLGRDSSAANFTLDRWTITASAGANGTVTPNGVVGVVEGASQHFSIVPATGYHVSGLTVDGGAVAPDTSYTFSNVSAHHTLSASFSTDQFAVTVSTVGGGTVSRAPELASYPYGSQVELDATAGSGWAFAGWSGDTSASSDPLLLTVMANRALTATFVDVAAPQVRLSAPVGGEEWVRGSVQSITWSASDNAGVDSVDVDYSLSGPGGPWVAVAHGVAHTGTTAWTLPETASDSALVRVSAWDAAHNEASAVSDSVFRIVDPAAGVGLAGRVLALARPQPNPSRGGALLRFALPAAGSARLEIVDLAGRRVWQAEGEWAAGPQALRWDGRAAQGGTLQAGLYFVRLVTPWGTKMERLVALH